MRTRVLRHGSLATCNRPVAVASLLPLGCKVPSVVFIDMTCDHPLMVDAMKNVSVRMSAAMAPACGGAGSASPQPSVNTHVTCKDSCSNARDVKSMGRLRRETGVQYSHRSTEIYMYTFTI